MQLIRDLPVGIQAFEDIIVNKRIFEFKIDSSEKKRTEKNITELI